jgi:hypothetical protein
MSWTLSHILILLPACQEDQKKCKEESVNVMHECDVERMYAVYHVLYCKMNAWVYHTL